MLSAGRSDTPHVNSDLDLGSRETSMTYPNGQVLSYNYGSSGSLNDVIGRLDNIGEGSLTLQSYQYLGLGTVVVQDDVQAGIELTYLYQSGDLYANFDGGDQYTGLDRFGRVVDQNYIDSGGDSVERYQYSYDRDGNVAAKNNLVAEATGGVGTEFDETYDYDDLNRLTSDTRGGSDYQSWDLDAVGNMNSITTGGSPQYNSFNSQNQMTNAGSMTLGFDSNGNTTIDDNNDTLIYDAWNRLVEVKNSGGGVITTYSYDGLGRQITQAPTGGTTIDLYYSSAWQVLEVQHSGTTVAQYVWDAGTGYVNQMVLRDAFSGGSFSYRIYALQDANYNVTALVAYDSGTSTWNVTQRYVYDAYGTFLTLNAGFTSTTDAYYWKYQYQGGRFDAAVGLYNFRNREYSPTLQRWTQQDPAGSVDALNLYQAMDLSPVALRDPYGLDPPPNWSMAVPNGPTSAMSLEQVQAYADESWNREMYHANQARNAGDGRNVQDASDYRQAQTGDYDYWNSVHNQFYNREQELLTGASQVKEFLRKHPGATYGPYSSGKESIQGANYQPAGIKYDPSESTWWKLQKPELSLGTLVGYGAAAVTGTSSAGIPLPEGPEGPGADEPGPEGGEAGRDEFVVTPTPSQIRGQAAGEAASMVAHGAAGVVNEFLNGITSANVRGWYFNDTSSCSGLIMVNGDSSHPGILDPAVARFVLVNWVGITTAQADRLFGASR